MNPFRSWFVRFDPNLAANWTRFRSWLLIFLVCSAITIWIKPVQLFVGISLEARFCLSVISGAFAHLTLFFSLWTSSMVDELDSRIPGAALANYWGNIVQRTVYYSTLAVMEWGSMNFWGIGLG